jgi:hypothetical protein
MMGILVTLMAFYDDWWAWLSEKGSPIIQFIMDHPLYFAIGGGGLVAILAGYFGYKHYKTQKIGVSQADKDALMAEAEEIRKKYKELE